MINTEKEYWFAFEPYVFITLKEKAALLYNTGQRNNLRDSIFKHII